MVNTSEIPIAAAIRPSNSMLLVFCILRARLSEIGSKANRGSGARGAGNPTLTVGKRVNNSSLSKLRLLIRDAAGRILTAGQPSAV